MNITCPCCRAANASGPQCRRCKADLGLLFALEEQNEDSKTQAVEALLQGDYENALAIYRNTVRNGS